MFQFIVFGAAGTRRNAIVCRPHKSRDMAWEECVGSAEEYLSKYLLGETGDVALTSTAKADPVSLATEIARVTRQRGVAVFEYQW